MDVITFLENLYTTTGLLILLHGVISLLDAMSYDKYHTLIDMFMPAYYKVPFAYKNACIIGKIPDNAKFRYFPFYYIFVV